MEFKNTKWYLLIVPTLLASLSCQTLKPIEPTDETAFKKYEVDISEVMSDRDGQKKSTVLYYSTGKLIEPILTIYQNKFLPAEFLGPVFDSIHLVPELSSSGPNGKVSVDKSKFFNGCMRQLKSKFEYRGAILSSEPLSLRPLSPSEFKNLNLPYLNQNICAVTYENVADASPRVQCQKVEYAVYQANVHGLTLYLLVDQPNKNHILLFEPLAGGRGYAEVLNFRSQEFHSNFERSYKGVVEETKGQAREHCQFLSK